MNGFEGMPDGLRSAVTSGLRPDPRSPSPIRPRLRPPSARVVVLAALAIALVSAVPISLEWRSDVALLGGWRSLGLSLLQWLGGVSVLAAALTEAVPGRQLAARRLLLLVLAASTLFTGLTLSTLAVHRTLVPHGAEAIYLRVCLGCPPILALPLLAASLMLVFRAFPVRPVLAGTLAGLGSGLVADAGWRLYCEVTEPTHVFAVHGGAMLLSTLLGAALAWVVALWRERRGSNLSSLGRVL